MVKLVGLRLLLAGVGFQQGAAVLVFVVGLALSGYAWMATSGNLEALIRKKAQTQVDMVESELRERLHAYENILYGAAGLFGANDNVNLQQWTAYGESLSLETRYRGFNTMGYTALLTPEEIPAHEQMVRAWGIDEYRVKGKRDVAKVSAVTLLYPHTFNRLAFGNDPFGTSPERRQAAELARDSGRLVLTAPVVPRANPGNKAGKVIIANVPVYRADMRQATIAERRMAFRGFVFVITYAQDMMRDVTEGLDNVDMAITDDSAQGGPEVVFASSPDPLRPPGRTEPVMIEKRIELGGRRWTIRAKPLPGIVTPMERRTPLVLSLSVLASSIFVTGFVFVAASTRRRAIALADAMTHDLSHARDFLSAVLDAIPNPVFVKNPEGRYVVVNEAFCRMCGRPSEQIVGHSDRDLVTAEEAQRYEEENRRLAEVGGSMAVEVPIRGDSGETRWWLKNKAFIELLDGNTYVIGVMSDIDERVRAREHLEDQSEKLQRLVDERTADLRTAKDVADAANRAKSEFLANMSHELRTPMHAIMSFAHLGTTNSSAPQPDPEKLTKYFDRIGTSGKRLLGLLNDLLDLAKLESGKMDYDWSRFDVGGAIHEAAREFEALAKDKGVVLRIVEGPEVPAWGDRSRIIQVLGNLLSNAIKFCPAERCVTVGWYADVLPGLAGSADSDSVQAAHLSVVDEGVGIPAGELDRVFGQFIQSSRTKTGAGGTGLGLSICRQIVLAHSGRIWAADNPGGGAQFHVVLPSAAPDVDAAVGRAIVA